LLRSSGFEARTFASAEEFLSSAAPESLIVATTNKTKAIR